ncbi:MAG: hypothetical protein AB7I27_16590 [Bacteriovoracaceae bacterium]
MNIRKVEFQEALVCQYRDLIQEAILESETDHKTTLNIGKLNSKLKVICKAAHYDGLHEEIINRLIDEAIPATAMKTAA